MRQFLSVLKRYIPIGIIVALMILVYFLGLHGYISMATLQQHRKDLVDFVSQYPVLSPFIFILIYFFAVSISFPGSVFITILGGFLFSQPLSTIYVIIGATSGATLVFLVAKTATGDAIRSKAGPLVQKMEKGFQENATSYLLFLRFVPIFPFWAVNLAPALFGVKIKTFVWTTMVGIIPGTFVFTQAGAGLAAILDTDGNISVDDVFNWQVRVALIALGFFALIPILVKKLRNRKDKNN